ncbi:WD40/YVTN/BNR-like repeat-containing protein [Fidelibacter multiformis]|uniref:WD40/YVTN/BNR-like repeat-containing protein n=1 Tax=Fidelibacter multiformis TaxID=3377529 RepID=UPI0037DD66A6
MNIHKQHIFRLKSPLIYTLLLPFLITACFSPEPEDYGLALEAVDVVCVEATFRVTASGVPETWTCGLYRDDSLVVTETLSGQSGYIRDTGLLPAADYTYHISYMKDGRDKDRSDPIAVTTPDTTSHDFTWTVETLGDAGSTLNDVAIVDENNIWVVGNINTPDGEYNAARWNGSEWEFMGIYSNTLDLYSIWYFAEDDIWVLSSYPIHWDGESWTHYHLTEMGIIPGGLGGSIWGASPNDVWFVGRYGRIVHYDGSRFRRISNSWESQLDWSKVKGMGNDVFVVGYTRFSPFKSAFINIKNGECKTLMSSNTANGIWDRTLGVFSDWGHMITFDILKEHLYVRAIQGILKFPYSKDYMSHWIMYQDYPGDFYVDMDTKAENDILMIGAIRQFIHFNGKSWKNVFSNPNIYCEYRAMDRKEDLVIVVGDQIVWGKKVK